MIPDWQQALQKVLVGWEGTPWMAGQLRRGRDGGVDCVRFVVAVLDELHRFDLPPIPRLPQDMSLHDRAGAYRVAKSIAGRYPSAVIDGGSIEAGDVVVVAQQEGGGPGHVLIAGVRPLELWHASPAVGVCRTSAAVIGEILGHWRPTARETWRS